MNFKLPMSGHLYEAADTLAMGNTDLKIRLRALLEKVHQDGWDQGYDQGCYEACYGASQSDLVDTDLKPR